MVRFSPCIDIIPIAGRDDYPIRCKQDNNHKDFVSAYFSNITCFGPNAKSHDFSQECVADLHVLVENHVPADQLSVFKAAYARHGMRTFNNPARVSTTSDMGTYGGESISASNHLNISAVPQYILDTIASNTGMPCNIMGSVLKLRHTSVLIVAVYFISGSPNNYNILKQVKYLREIYKLPFIAVGDWNMTDNELRQSCWIEELMLDAVIIAPQDTLSTLKNKADRRIDYIVITRSIRALIQNLKTDTETPWLHFGLFFDIYAQPRSNNIVSLIRPKVLPVGVALDKFEALNNFEKYKSYRKAYKKAKYILNKQKNKSGVAILGKPTAVLANDLKFQVTI